MQLVTFSRDNTDNQDSLNRIIGDLQVVHSNVADRLRIFSEVTGNQIRLCFSLAPIFGSEGDAVELITLSIPLDEETEIGPYIYEPVSEAIRLRTHSRIQKYFP